ncbi:MAG: PAS domain S-box protein [Lentisphaeria bacterium]|nr:ATP-binding protein [Lentisphaeria bacterium]NQZ68523.1 PAS domain S-box protein [Lentisphaeria bacterium]
MGVVSKIVVVCSDAYRSSISKCLDTLPDLNFMYIDVEEHVDIPEDALAVVISSLNYEENISFYSQLNLNDHIPVICISELGEDEVIKLLSKGIDFHLEPFQISRLPVLINKFRKFHEHSDFHYMNHLPYVIVAVDRFHQLKYMNKLATTYFGHFSNLKKVDWFEHYIDHDNGITEDSFFEFLISPVNEFHLDFPIIDINKESVDMQWRILKIENDAVLFCATVCSVDESSLERIHDQEILLDQSTDAVFVCENNGTIIYMNHTVSLLYGFDPHELKGRTIDVLCPSSDYDVFGEIHERALKSREWIGEMRQVDVNGDEFIVCSRWSVMNESGHLLITNTDMTDMKVYEDHFLRTQRLESIGTLAGGVAHDLNNVLSPIIMASFMLQMKVTDKKSQKLLKTIEESAERGSEIIKQILAFAKGDDNQLGVVQPKHILRETFKIISSTFPKTVEIISDIPKGLWTIQADAVQIQQIILNLCLNAKDAINSDGKINIHAENIIIDKNFSQLHPDAEVGPYLKLSVVDNGHGILPDHKDKIFQAFFTTKEYGQGTGLGLSTVMTIIKRHHGFVLVDSHAGLGTNFQVFIPALPENYSVENNDMLSLFDVRKHEECILLIDESEELLELTTELLEAYGYRCMQSTNAAEAIGTYVQYQDEIDLVLTNLHMSDMNGASILRAIRKINDKALLIASGHDYTKEVGELFNAALKRPYTARKLLQTINDCLEVNYNEEEALSAN